MKRKRLFSKISAIILVFCLILTVCPTVSAFAAETKESSIQEDELCSFKEFENEFALEGDLSLEELKTAELAPEDTPEIVTEESIEKNEHVTEVTKHWRSLK